MIGLSSTAIVSLGDERIVATIPKTASEAIRISVREEYGQHPRIIVRRWVKIEEDLVPTNAGFVLTAQLCVDFVNALKTAYRSIEAWK